MSGETEANISAWTIDSLHAHLIVLLNTRDALLAERDRRYEQRFVDQEKAILTALATSSKAIDKAETATELRFQGVNEFRQTLSDQAAQFITRTEVTAGTARNTERIQEIATRLEGALSRTEATASERRLESRINDLEKRVTERDGRGTGLNAGWVYLIGLIATIGVIVTVYLALRGH